jgi:predicted GIY-YIG superfamily endonuclease
MIQNRASPKEKPMTALPTYDIFKRSDENLVWVEAVSDLDTANARIKELQRCSKEEFVVFDQRTQELVVSNQP